MQVLKDGRLGLSLSRKLKKVGYVYLHVQLSSDDAMVLNFEQEEIDGALQAFIDAERRSALDDAE